jgi:hypothetical protein
MSGTASFNNLDLARIPDGLRVGGASDAPLLGVHEGIGNFPGMWTGKGFNLIWRPHVQPGDHFLQLNLTSDAIEFAAIGGPVPNRGLIEPDIAIYAIRYLQQIHDTNFPPPSGGGTLHVEPGFWLSIPSTIETANAPSLVRAASIPHGTTILTQGGAIDQLPPVIPSANTTPFNANGPISFSELDLGIASAFRTSPLPIGITPEMVDDPNVLLIDTLTEMASKGLQVTEAIEIQVTAESVTPGGQAALGAIGGIPFLGPNADVTNVSATFWLERVANVSGATFLQLQYSQTVLLNFNGISWPHVTVGTLVKSD